MSTGNEAVLLDIVEGQQKPVKHNQNHRLCFKSVSLYPIINSILVSKVSAKTKLRVQEVCGEVMSVKDKMRRKQKWAGKAFTL